MSNEPASQHPDLRPPTPIAPPTIGMVGAGQLARMTHQAAIGLGIPLRIMAVDHTESAAQVSPHVDTGSPHRSVDLIAFAEGCDVVTFDHELVDLDALGTIEASGSAVARPPASALTYATDKAHQRRRFAQAGFPLPDHRITDDPHQARSAMDELGWPVVVKTARGGYDGRGVWILDGPDEADALLAELTADSHMPTVIIEVRVALESEFAVLVARRPGGQMVSYPLIETVQVAGICRETIAPAPVPEDLAERARQLGEAVAEEVGAIGIIAVELFFDGTDLTINEVATRPHNSGHWTIEGAVTSQFANHLRAVADLPLGSTEMTTSVAVTANILGHDDGRDPILYLSDALAVPGASVHLYGKASRPGRKLGHVTVLAGAVDDARRRAGSAVAALGAPVPGVSR